jgi:hypothetical protein
LVRKIKEDDEMQLSDRNSRLLLICSGIGVFGYIIKVIIQSIYHSFSIIYLGPFPIGIGQIFSTILFANALIIFGTGICYGYFELHNYGNYEGEEKTRYQVTADKCYRLLLKISYTSLLMALVLIFILFCILPLFIAFKLIFIIFIGLILLIFFKVTIKKWSRNWFKEFIGQVKKLKKFYIHAIIAFVWTIFLPSLIIMGISQNLNTHFDITFKNGDVPNAIFHFSDNAPDRMPKEFTITIDANSYHKELKLYQEEFNYSIVEVKGTELNNSPLAQYLQKNKTFDVSNSNYTFNKTIDLQDIISRKEGSIEIKFKEENDISGTRTYRVVNKFTVLNGKIQFNQEKFNIKL